MDSMNVQASHTQNATLASSVSKLLRFAFQDLATLVSKKKLRRKAKIVKALMKTQVCHSHNAMLASSVSKPLRFALKDLATLVSKKAVVAKAPQVANQMVLAMKMTTVDQYAAMSVRTQAPISTSTPACASMMHSVKLPVQQVKLLTQLSTALASPMV